MAVTHFAAEGKRSLAFSRDSGKDHSSSDAGGVHSLSTYYLPGAPRSHRIGGLGDLSEVPQPGGGGAQIKTPQPLTFLGLLL